MEQYTFAMVLVWLMILLYIMAAMADPALYIYKSPKAWLIAILAAGLALWGASVL
jgi:hypothetical protein